MRHTNWEKTDTVFRGRKRSFTSTSSFALWAVFTLILIGLASYASLSLFQASPASAVTTVPTKLNFQGRLSDASGNLKANGTYNMRFKLYTVATAGSAVWSEDRLVSATQGVTVTNGLFSVQLGSITSLPASLFASGALYLEVELPTPATATTTAPTWTEGPMTPRNQMATSAYAYNSETLDGQDGAYYLDSANLTGTISSARLSGSYTGITGTGALNAGSITTGFGTIVTGDTISGSQLISTVATGTAPLTVTSTTLVTNLNSQYLNGYSESQLAQSLRANINISGGGTIGFDGTNINWSARFIVIANGNGSDFSTNGYFDITMPASGTVITGVGGAGNATTSAAGVPLGTWQALYYVLPLGGSSASNAANFRIATYTTALQVPSNWVLIAVRNNDNSTVKFTTGHTLRSGQTATAGAIDNPTFNGALVGASTIQGTRLISTVATGTAPLTVTSTTLVTNLNADWLDGLNSTQFIRSDVADTTTGRLVISGGSTGNAYNQAPLELVQTYGATLNAPRVAFHYSGAVASQIGFLLGDNSGDIAVLDNPGTGYETLRVRDLKIGTLQFIDASGNITNAAAGTFSGTVSAGTLSSANLRVVSGNGNGLGFWGTVPSTYGIYMSNDVAGKYGDVTDYYLASNMSSGTGRGFSWLYGGVVGASLNASSGNFATKGSINIAGSYKINGVDVCTSAGCTAAGGAGATLAGNNTFTGTNTFKPSTNSTTAFRVQNAGGTTLLNSDTTNMRVSIGGQVTRDVSADTFPPLFGAAIARSISSPTGLVAGDFNVDGYQDIAVTAWDGSGYAILSIYTNASGTIPTTATATYSAGSNTNTASAPMVADFNSDGKPDIALINSSNVMSVFINNGNGTFAAKVDYVTGTAPNDITSGFFNADTIPDIAVVNNSSNTLSVFINNGNGTFAAKVDYVTGTAPKGVQAGDFNNDGKSDIAVVNGSSNTLSVFINNGNGTFAAKVDYAAGTSPSKVTVADFDSDGDIDIATSGNSTSNGMSTYMNNGNGTFAARTVYSYPSGNSPTGICAFDYNGDNIPEIILGATTPYVFVNDGGGSFSSSYSFSAPTYPYVLGCAIDYNNDGKNDILTNAAAVNQFSIIPNATVTAYGAETSVGTLSVVTGSPSSGGIFVQGSASQVASLLSVQDSTGTSFFSVGASGRTVMSSAQSESYATVIQNISTTTSADGLLIKLGVTNAARTASNYFVGFSDSVGNVAGKIQGGANTVAYTTSAADYAEYFRADPDNLPKPGELVTLDAGRANGVRHASGTDLAVGVVSTNPGFVGNGPICQVGDENCDTNYSKTNVLVSLVGQVPVKVIGDIQIGDALGASDMPGFATKVTSGSIVGYALTAAENGVVQVLIRPDIISPTSGSGMQGGDGMFTSLVVSGLITTKELLVEGDSTFMGSITVNGHIVSGGEMPVMQTGVALGGTDNAECKLSLDGNDTSGEITITTGTDGQPYTIGDLLQVTFAKGYTKVPRIMLSASNEQAVRAEVFVTGRTRDGFVLRTLEPLAPNTTYSFTYWAVE